MPAGEDDLERSSILDVVSYHVDLDLTQGPETFRSRTEVRFRCRKAGAATFADLHAVRVGRATLNGADLNPAAGLNRGHLELPRLADENTLTVEAEFDYASAAKGLNYVTDPADPDPAGPDGSAFVYANSRGASRIYCCFDRPDLRAAFTVSVTTPAGWSCLANAPVVSRPPAGERGIWRFAPTPPVPPWLTSVCAGPLHVSASENYERDNGHPLPITIQAVPSVPEEPTSIPELLRQSLRFYERRLGVPYPYGKCDLVFGPVSPALAQAVTGLIVIQDQVLRDSKDSKDSSDGSGLYLNAVIAHELAHTWFGGLVTMPPEDGWLDEALTTYISRTALEEILPGCTPWAAETSATLPDHAYAGDAAAIRQLEDLIGRQAVIDGLAALLRRHAHSQATPADLVACWSQASGEDLRAWAAETLRETETETETD
jgi:aminopeptidase N